MIGEGVGLPKTELPKTERSNILIGFIKLVLIGIIIVAAVYLINSLLSDNNQELNCGDTNQDGSNIIYQCPSGKTLKLPPNGNLCVGDTCTDTDCCVDSSSVRVCQRPSSSVLNNYNMTNVQENDLNMDSFDVTGITCNDGYSGEAVATVCTRPGGHYTVSGCTSSTDGTPTGVCIRPSNTIGYDNIQETNLSIVPSVFDVSVDCATGYTGRASANPCTVANEEYTLDGCTVVPEPTITRTCANINGDGTSDDPFDCSGETNSIASTPSSIHCTGDACTATECCTVVPEPECIRPNVWADISCYNLADISSGIIEESVITEDLRMSHFGVSGLSCRSHCGGSPVADVCTERDGPYILSGCNPITCADTNGDGTQDLFDCTNEVLDLHNDPSNQLCEEGVCDAETCCTTERPDPCSLSGITKPDDVNWGTICSEENIRNGLTIPDGVSCDFTCAPATGGSPQIAVANPTEYCQTQIENLQRVFGGVASEVQTMQQCLDLHVAFTGSSEEKVIKNQPFCRDGVFTTGTRPTCFGAQESLCVLTRGGTVRWIRC